MASLKSSPSSSTSRKSSIHTSILAARDMILGASSSSNALALHSNLDARHPSSKRAPRKRLALNTKLYFSNQSTITVTHAVMKPKLVGWEGGLKLVDGQTDVPPTVASSSTSSRASDHHSTTFLASESLAMTFLSVGSSSSSSSLTPTSRTSLRTALFQLPPSARPFQYTSYRNALDGPQIRNAYTPKFVEGQGWVPAFGGANNEPEPVPAPPRPAPASNGPRYPVRASRAKPAANSEAPASADAGEVGAPVDDKTAAPAKPVGKGKHKHHGKGKAKASKPVASAHNENMDEDAEGTPAPPASSAANLKKRVRVHDAAEDSANGDITMDDASMEIEEDNGRATRASKRRKVASDMPPPATIPAHAKGGSRKPNAREDSASFDGDNVEEPTSGRKTRSAKKARATSEVEGSPDTTMLEIEATGAVSSRSSSRLSKTRAGSLEKSASPPASSAPSSAAGPKDQPPKRSHKKKVPAPAAAQQVEPSSNVKAGSPAPATHSYSTRRAGGRTSKGRTSPSGTDETLVDAGTVDSISKIVPEPTTVPAVV